MYKQFNFNVQIGYFYEGTFMLNSVLHFSIKEYFVIDYFHVIYMHVFTKCLPKYFFFCFTRKRLQDKTCPQNKNSVMTMIFQKVPPGHRSRNKEDDIFLAVDQTSNRVLHYQCVREQSKLQIPVVRKPTQAKEIQQLKPDIDNVSFFYEFMNMIDSHT